MEFLLFIIMIVITFLVLQNASSDFMSRTSKVKAPAPVQCSFVRDKVVSISDTPPGQGEKEKATPYLRTYMKPVKWFISEWGVGDPSPAEQLIIEQLVKYNIHWEREVSFDGLLLPSKGWARFDFYLPEHKVCIEYRGKAYHVIPERRNSDFIKEEFCRANGIELIVWSSQEYYHIDQHVAELMTRLHIKQLA